MSKQCNSFYRPRHMSIEALVVYLAQYIRKNIFIIIIICIPKDADQSLWVSWMFYILIAFTLLDFFNIFLKFFSSTYYIHEGKIVFKHGFFSPTTHHIPLENIYSLRTKNGPIYQLLDLVAISFDTLKSETAEIELILNQKDWQLLKEAVQDENLNFHIQDTEVAEKVVAPETSFTMTNRQLFKAAISQNFLTKGLLVTIPIFGLLVNVLQRLSEINADKFNKYMDQLIDSIYFYGFVVQSIQYIILGIVFILLTFCIWCAYMYSHYYHLKLSINSQQLSYESGLFTRISAQFSPDKVSAIEIKQNPVEHFFNIKTIQLHQAKNVAGKNENNLIKIYGWTDADSIMMWRYGNIPSTFTPLFTAYSGNGVFWHNMFFNLIGLISLSLLPLFYFTIDEKSPSLYLFFGLLELLLIGICIGNGIFSKRHSYVSLYPTYTEIGFGHYAQKKGYIQAKDIETISIRHTLFYRFFKCVKLSFHTNGSSFTIRSLKETEALTIYNHIIQEKHDNS